MIRWIARLAVVAALLAVGVVVYNETKTETALSPADSERHAIDVRHHRYAELLKRCEQVVWPVRVDSELRARWPPCRLPGTYGQTVDRATADKDLDRLHQTVMMRVTESFPKTGTRSIYGPFFICESESQLRIGKARHYVLYRVERAEGWRAIAIPSDSMLLAEWSHQSRVLPDTTDPREPKGE